MADKTIMLACSAGMSTSLLVSKMQNAAKEKGKDYKIFATAASGIQDEIDKEHPDVLLLGPQVQYMEDSVKKITDEAGIPLAVINMQDYGMMNGEHVLETAQELMGDKQSMNDKVKIVNEFDRNGHHFKIGVSADGQVSIYLDIETATTN